MTALVNNLASKSTEFVAIVLAIVGAVIGTVLCCGIMYFYGCYCSPASCAGKRLLSQYPAITKADIGKQVTIKGSTLLVDGVPRSVQWHTPVLSDKGKLESPRGLSHIDIENRMIADVDDSIGGTVSLQWRQGVGAAFFENRACKLEIAYEQLAMKVGLGNVSASSRDLPAQKPVRLVKAQYFVDAWSAGNMLCPRFALSEDNFYDGPFDSPALQIIAIAYPGPDGESSVAQSAQAMLMPKAFLYAIAMLLKARKAHSPRLELAVFIDVCSLDPRVLMTYEQGIASIPSIFAHPTVEVWILDGAIAGTDGARGGARGWLTVEKALACTILKKVHTCLDLSALHIAPERVKHWKKQIVQQCSVPQRAPASVGRLSALLADNPFARRADMHVALQLYHKHLTESLGSLSRLECRGFGWGDQECVQLAEILPYAEQLRILDLSGNPLIGDIGAGALAAVLPTSLCSLDLRASGRKPKLRCPNSNPTSPAAIMRFRATYEGHVTPKRQAAQLTPLPRVKRAVGLNGLPIEDSPNPWTPRSEGTSVEGDVTPQREPWDGGGGVHPAGVHPGAASILGPWDGGSGIELQSLQPVDEESPTDLDVERDLEAQFGVTPARLSGFSASTGGASTSGASTRVASTGGTPGWLKEATVEVRRLNVAPAILGLALYEDEESSSPLESSGPDSVEEEEEPETEPNPLVEKESAFSRTPTREQWWHPSAQMAAVKVQSLVRGHQARGALEEARRIESLRFYVAEGAYDEALKFAITPAEEAAIKQHEMEGDPAAVSDALEVALSPAAVTIETELDLRHVEAALTAAALLAASVTSEQDQVWNAALDRARRARLGQQNEASSSDLRI
jgi:hypothetical protein